MILEESKGHTGPIKLSNPRFVASVTDGVVCDRHDGGCERDVDDLDLRLSCSPG